MRWFVTGDTHGDWSKIWDWLIRMNFDQNKNINVIILGDAGLYWKFDKKDAESIIKHHENNFKAHIFFLDGNHENFDILKTLQITPDGVAHISEHIHYLPRGFCGWLQITSDYGLKIAVCGGADSIDQGRRLKGISWWEDEKITQKDIDKINQEHYDYVLTHCCPRSVFEQNKIYLANLTNIPATSILHDSEDMLEQLKNKITFRKWLFGHYHIDKELDNNFICVFNDFIELERKGE